MLSVDPASLILTVVNLLVLLVGLKIFLFKPVQKIIAARQAEADQQFGEAATKQAEADELKTQYQKSLAGIEDEKKKTLQAARKDADAQYQKIVTDAQDKARQIKEDAMQQAEHQKAQIIKGAEKEIADMVVDAATKVVGKQSGEDVDRSLYSEFLNKAGE